MTEDASFGKKHIARISVTSDESIVVRQKPVTLTASIENRLDELLLEHLYGTSDLFPSKHLRQPNDLSLSMDGKVFLVSTRSQYLALSLQTSRVSS